MTARPPPSFFASWPAFLWLFFLVWTAIAAVVLPFGLGAAEIREWIYARDLRFALIQFIGYCDVVWVVLAAVLSYLALVRNEGLAVARRWSLVLLAGSASLAAIGALTGFPFGPFIYTGRFGWRILGVVPFAVPLLWLTVVVCARYAVLVLRPAASRWQLALGTGFLSLLTDLNLEPVAWKVRAYWLWYPQQSGAQAYPPLQNYATWFVAATLLALAFPSRGVDRSAAPRDRQAVTILALLNGVYLLVHLVRGLRG